MRKVFAWIAWIALMVVSLIAMLATFAAFLTLGWVIFEIMLNWGMIPD